MGINDVRGRVVRPDDGCVDQEGTNRHCGTIDVFRQVKLGDRSKNHGLTQEDTEGHNDQEDHCGPHHRIRDGEQVNHTHTDGDDGQSDSHHGGGGLEDVVSEDTCNQASNDADEAGREDTEGRGLSGGRLVDAGQVGCGGVDQVDVAPVDAHTCDTCEPHAGLDQNLAEAHEGCGVLGVSFGLCNSVCGDEAEDGEDVRDQQQGVAQAETNHDAVSVSRESSDASDDDQVHAEFEATTQRLEEAHGQAAALGVRIGGHEADAVNDGGPTDCIPHCPCSSDNKKGCEVQVVAQNRGEPQEQEGQQSPRSEGDEDLADREAVVHPTCRNVHEHCEAEDGHDLTEVSNADAQCLGHRVKQRTLECLEGDVDKLSGEDDSKVAADAALLHELRKARLCAY